MTKTPQDIQREHMARTLSKAYGWDFNELMQMSWEDLSDTFTERYLDYIYGV
jgi:hypothetical protein